MKKIVLAIVLVIASAAFLAAVGWAVIYLWKNFGGILRIAEKPSANIVNVVEKQKTPPEQKTPPGFPLKLPDGFSISIFAQGLGGPRVIISDGADRLLTSVTSEGRVVALPDENADGVADEIITVLEGLNKPHGLAMRCRGDGEGKKCHLYIAESDKVSVYDYDQVGARAVNKRKIVDLPDGGRHFTRTLLFMPVSPDGSDNKLLISVGSSCDVCYESDRHRAKILIADAENGDLKIFASGLRNSVFIAIHPKSGEIWATEMGRDFLGDDLPPDEINIIREGKNYGWPICYGKNIHDAVFDKNVYIRNPCLLPFEIPSYIDIPAHSAPLGLAFIPEEGWPQYYGNNLLVAYHGSWNRSQPTGYKIVRYKLDEQGRYLGEEDFISGWLAEDGSVLGRPVDILIQPDGAAYVSDDKAGVIYRIVYQLTP